MKKVLVLCSILVFTACMKKEVEIGDPNLSLRSGKLYYKEKLFTGKIIQKVPLTEDKFIKMKYSKGVLTSK